MKFVKLISVLLLLAMLLSLCACGEDSEAKNTEPTTEPTTEAPTTEPTTVEPTTEPTTTETTTEEPTELVIDHEILGTWDFSYPCAELMEQTMLAAGYECDFADDIALSLSFTFHEDGTYEMQADEASAQAMVQEMLNVLAGLMPDMLYAEFARQQGWDKATTDAQLAAQGLTMESLVETTMSQVDPSSIDFSGSFAAECFYTIEGDRYYLASTMEDLLAGNYIESMQFALEGDTLQILACEIYDEDAASLEEIVPFPMELTRK